MAAGLSRGALPGPKGDTATTCGSPFQEKYRRARKGIAEPSSVCVVRSSTSPHTRSSATPATLARWRVIRLRNNTFPAHATRPSARFRHMSPLAPPPSCVLPAPNPATGPNDTKACRSREDRHAFKPFRPSVGTSACHNTAPTPERRCLADGCPSYTRVRACTCARHSLSDTTATGSPFF